MRPVVIIIGLIVAAGLAFFFLRPKAEAKASDIHKRKTSEATKKPDKKKGKYPEPKKMKDGDKYASKAKVATASNQFHGASTVRRASPTNDEVMTLVENARLAEKHYDTMKDREGWDKKIAGAVIRVGADTFTLGISEVVWAVAPDLSQYSKEDSWKLHEESVAELKRRVPEKPGAPGGYYQIAAWTHEGEEYTWSQLIVGRLGAMPISTAG